MKYPKMPEGKQRCRQCKGYKVIRRITKGIRSSTKIETCDRCKGSGFEPR